MFECSLYYFEFLNNPGKYTWFSTVLLLSHDLVCLFFYRNNFWFCVNNLHALKERYIWLHNILFKPIFDEIVWFWAILELTTTKKIFDCTSAIFYKFILYPKTINKKRAVIFQKRVVAILIQEISIFFTNGGLDFPQKEKSVEVPNKFKQILGIYKKVHQYQEYVDEFTKTVFLFYFYTMFLCFDSVVFQAGKLVQEFVDKYYF